MHGFIGVKVLLARDGEPALFQCRLYPFLAYHVDRDIIGFQVIFLEVLFQPPGRERRAREDIIDGRLDPHAVQDVDVRLAGPGRIVRGECVAIRQPWRSTRTYLS